MEAVGWRAIAVPSTKALITNAQLTAHNNATKHGAFMRWAVDTHVSWSDASGKAGDH